MKIIITCQECLQNHFSKSKAPLSPEGMTYSIQLSDNGTAEYTCQNYHKIFITTQFIKYEMLFERAVYAFIDGYYREAIATIAASLERFYEFYMEIICSKHGIGKNEFDKNWKEVKKQSERQYGALRFIYLLDNKKNLDTDYLKNWSEFRNNVIHQGYIATEIETREHANKALQHIKTMIKELNSSENLDVLNQIIGEKKSKNNEILVAKEKEGYKIYTYGELTALHPNLCDDITFDEMVKKISETKQWKDDFKKFIK